MSVSGQTEEECGADEMGAPERDLYDQKAVSKVVRVLTVLAYLLSVSLAAILLSVYYVCVWKSPELPLLNDTLEVSARRAAAPSQHSEYFPDTFRGGNSTVSDNATQILGNITDDGFWNGNDTGGQLHFASLSDEPDTNTNVTTEDAKSSVNDTLNTTSTIT